MSLADELLADFEEDDLGQNEEEEADEEMAEVAEVAAEVDYTSKESVRHVAKLRDSKEVGAFSLCKSFKFLQDRRSGESRYLPDLIPFYQTDKFCVIMPNYDTCIQSLTKVAVLPVIRSGFYEDLSRNLHFAGPNVRHNFSPIISKYFLIPSQACLECS